MSQSPHKQQIQWWLGLFTVDSWREFKANGGTVMGFNEKKAPMAARLKTGDRIICYLSKVSAFIAIMEVTGPAYHDTKPIWRDGLFPTRLPVNVLHEVELSDAVPIRSLKDKLSFLIAAAGSNFWTIHVLSSPKLWQPADGRTVEAALKKAKRTHAPADVIRVPQGKAPLATGQKAKTIGNHVRVGRIITKTRALAAAEEAGLLGSYENALSFNKVTGYSVNVPIAETCRPTAMCMKTCYFASGAPSWSNALRHQRKIYASMKADPAAFAQRVAMEYDRLDLSFIRWNGGGDLFAENVATINHLARIRPDMILWVVTRIPEWAALIDDLPNVFIHFSLDKHSLSRREEFLKLSPRSSNYFFSYQCDKDEVPDPAKLEHVSVLFFDNYHPTTDLKKYPAEIVCPLNGAEDITDTCEWCRRCFNGKAVKHSARVHAGDDERACEKR